ncbi:Hypothetical predicted protein [Prunus dulcis]|uniref:Uncharacterized protein n=1 Tax=Prunus dulcis TaxID=3755 RepID=A0A5E4FNG3_PRUDU|nr:Hypothetical predicted protein [Prunus dulcis]
MELRRSSGLFLDYGESGKPGIWLSLKVPKLIQRRLYSSYAEPSYCVPCG